MMEEEVVIVGAGIAGLATAVALRRVGIRALVLERSPSLRAAGAALTLFPNAWRALHALGVAHKLSSLYSARKKVRITNVATGAVQQISLVGTNGDGPITVHRKAILESLAEELPTESIRFSSKPILIEAQTQEGPYTLCLEDGTLIITKVLIGCDGVNSFVARELGLTKPVNSGRSGVVALSVFPEDHGIHEDVLQFVNVGTRAGIIPLTGNEVCWFITFNTPKGDQGVMTKEREPEEIKKQVIENYAKDFPPIYAQVVHQTVISTLTFSSLKLRLPWDLIFGKISKGTMTVAGDAMHPMTPDLAHGGCSALEDAVVLGRHIGKSFIDNGRLVPGAVSKAIEAYVKERRWRAAWLITGSYISGWVQSRGEGLLMTMLKEVVFYRFLFKKLLQITDYDCGKLPYPFNEPNI